jgi:hypothetical protein
MRVPRRIFSIFVGVIAVCWLLPAVVQACRCLPPASSYIGLKNSDVVFVGKVTNIETIAADGWLYGALKQAMGSRIYEFETILVTLDVKTPFKAVDESPVIIETLESRDLCGIPFKAGQEYLVYAKHSPEGELMTDLCTRTDTVARAAEDIANLVKE